MNQWVYRQRPVDPDDIIRAIVSTEGLRAAWVPDGKGTSNWVWIRVVKNSPITCSIERACTEHEIHRLNDLLRGEIICRMIRDANGASWAVASFE